MCMFLNNCCLKWNHTFWYVDQAARDRAFTIPRHFSGPFLFFVPSLSIILFKSDFKLADEVESRNIFIYKVIDPSSLFKFLQVKPTYTCLVKKIVISINLSLPCAMKADISLSTRVDHRLYN